LLRGAVPVTLVAGGAVIGFLPGVPDVTLDPDLVLSDLPAAAPVRRRVLTSVRDLRRNAKPIALLSIPLVVVTMGAVARSSRTWSIGLELGPAFVLGAIVSPTDAVAPAEIMRPHRRARRLIRSSRART
jgi:CPA1 family monovalent cation:H+ antiporter